MANTDWSDLKFVVDQVIHEFNWQQIFSFAFCTIVFCIFAKSFGNFNNNLL